MSDNLEYIEQQIANENSVLEEIKTLIITQITKLKVFKTAILYKK